MRKIRYINVHGYMLLGYTNNFFDTYQKALRQQFPNLDVSDNFKETYQGTHNAIIAIDGRKIVGIIDFGNDNYPEIHYLQVVSSSSACEIIKDLLDMAMYELKSNQPIITIPNRHMSIFEPIINELKWERSSYGISLEYPDGFCGFNEFKKEKVNRLLLQKKKQP